MSDSLEKERFLALLPRLVTDDGFLRDLEAGLEPGDRTVLREVLDGKVVSGASAALVFDAACSAFDANRTSVLSLAWDGDAPGMSGALDVSEVAGVCVISSSDFDDEGPFESVEEALESDRIQTVMPNPELTSESLSLERLLQIASRVVDPDSRSGVWVNSDRYLVKEGSLVRQAPK